MGWGWCLADEIPTKFVDLELEFADGIEQVISCLIDRARDDVAKAFPDNARASTAGFIYLSRLASTCEIQRATLLIRLTDNTFERYPIQGFPEAFALDSTTPQSTFNRIRRVWLMAKSGRFPYILQRLQAMFSRRRKALSHRAVTGSLPMGNSHLVIDHQLGGGANKYRDEKIAQILRLGEEVVLVTFELPRLLFRLEIYRPSGKQLATYESIQVLGERLMQAQFSTIHVNDLVSFPDGAEILQLITALHRRGRSELRVYLHDFLYVCPSYALIDATGRYCGIPDADVCRQCLKTNKSVFPSFAIVDEILPWRKEWKELLRESTNIIAFSESTINIFRQAFPMDEWRPKISIQPHQVDVSKYPKIKVHASSLLKIAVIGHIGFAKGAEIVHEMVTLIARKQLAIQIVVIGTLERFIPSPALIVTGSFENSKLPTLLQEHGIGVCLLPSICPETFSYVAEEVMTMGLPLVCFELGAPADRVKRYSFGEVAKTTSAQGALDAVISLSRKVGAGNP